MKGILPISLLEQDFQNEWIEGIRPKRITKIQADNVPRLHPRTAMALGSIQNEIIDLQRVPPVEVTNELVSGGGMEA